MDLSLSHVISVSLTLAASGLSNFNPSNLAIFTDEQPNPAYSNGPSGSARGFGIYYSSLQVAKDYGTGSKTYAQAVAIFSQTPNILAGGGYLVVIPMTQAVAAIQTITPGGVPASGTFVLNFGGNATGALNWNDNAATIQTALRALAGLGAAVVTGTVAGGLSVTGFPSGPAALITVTANTVATAGSAPVVFTVATGTAGALTETLTAAIARANPMVQFFGILANATIDSGDWTSAAAAVQSLNQMLGRASYQKADLAANTGWLWALQNSGDFRTRGMYYGNLGTQSDANMAIAAAFSRGMAVDFTGSNTVMTQELKTLNGVPTDTSLDEATFTLAQNAGAMIYPGYQGQPGLQDFNTNGGFFDEIFNSSWFQGALQVAGFNVIKQSGTKVAQTDNGVETLLGAYRRVCLQAVTNGYLAPGAWTAPDTFGNPADFLRNIQEQGFYLYAPPVAQQLPSDRAARKAPAVQIAGKEAGAIHSSNVMVNINP